MHIVKREALIAGKSIIPKWHPNRTVIFGEDVAIELKGDLYIRKDKVYGCGSAYTGFIKGKPEQVGVVLK